MSDRFDDLLRDDTESFGEIESSLPDDQRIPAAPQRLPEAALHGIADEIVLNLLPQTEADPAALLGEILEGFGCFIGRTAHIKHEATPHYANLFLAKVGISSKARKGTASDRIAGAVRARKELRKILAGKSRRSTACHPADDPNVVLSIACCVR